ncbi:MAG: P-loop NTPase [Ectothiorhodospiraceae bacterium]|nr:P-loop NTPase [Ectothiorhodospiraceae bacterium]
MSTIEKAMGRLKKAAGGQQQVNSPLADTPDARTGMPASPGRADVARPSGEKLMVDFRQLRRYGIFPPDAMKPGVRDQYRRIKRPLLANAIGRKGLSVDRGNLIMVTSALPGEGKTFTSLNLALSIAQDPDFSVTLVDGDVVRAHVSRLLGVRDTLGLLDLLADESIAPGELVRPTTVESLNVLPAGRPHPRNEELLSSSRMERVISALADRNRHHIMLFDSPPLLSSPAALSLSSAVGQVVVVVKAGSTLRHQVVEAVDLLDQSKAINMVLNQTLGGIGGEEYGDYYQTYSDSAGAA